MALSMGSIQHEEVVSRSDPPEIYDVGQASTRPGRNLTLLWVLPFWLGRLLLARLDSNGLLPSHAVLREQSSASQARASRGRRFQPEHLVAWSSPDNGVG